MKIRIHVEWVIEVDPRWYSEDGSTVAPLDTILANVTEHWHEEVEYTKPTRIDVEEL